MAQHFSRLGVSASNVPTVRRLHKFINHLKFDNNSKPWESDATTLLTGSGAIQNKVNSEYRQMKRNLQYHANEEDRTKDDENTRKSTTGMLKKEYIERLKPLYLNNARNMVTHTKKNEDGHLVSINVHLLDNDYFFNQVEKALQDIFLAAAPQLPYKLALGFGFMLYKEQGYEIKFFYVNEHLQRDVDNVKVIQQLPNIWTIGNVDDEKQIVEDLP